MPRDYVEELKLIISSNEDEDIKRSDILQYHESDIADALEELTKEERLMLYHILGDEIVSEIFAYLDDVEDYIEEISSQKAADIIELMDADDAIDILDELDEEELQPLKPIKVHKLNNKILFFIRGPPINYLNNFQLLDDLYNRYHNK